MSKIFSIQGVFLIALLLPTISCGSEDDNAAETKSGHTHACTTVDSWTSCVEYTTPEPEPDLDDECTQMSGVVSAICSRTGVQGSCTITNGISSIGYFFYDLAPEQLTEARLSCQDVWKDGG